MEHLVVDYVDAPINTRATTFMYDWHRTKSRAGHPELEEPSLKITILNGYENAPINDL
jgi:hypothetical protein